MKSSGKFILKAFLAVAGTCFLNTLAKGIPLNNSQVNLLTNIAFQCPYEGGTAVFRARALLSGITEDVFDDETLCGQQGSQGLMLPPMVGNEVKPEIVLFPNPAQHSVTVRMQEAIKGEVELSIYNLYGQKLEVHLLGGMTDYSFSTENMPQGIYLVRIQQGKEIIYSTKLVIAR